jgi:hypothetical protein
VVVVVVVVVQASEPKAGCTTPISGGKSPGRFLMLLAAALCRDKISILFALRHKRACHQSRRAPVDNPPQRLSPGTLSPQAHANASPFGPLASHDFGTAPCCRASRSLPRRPQSVQCVQCVQWRPSLLRPTEGAVESESKGWLGGALSRAFSDCK